MADKQEKSDLRQRLIGLGERSIKKSYYPELQKRLTELERFRDVLDRASDAIFLAEAATGHIADSNQTATTLSGYSSLELNRRSLFSLFEQGLTVLPRITEPIITQLKHRDGRLIPVEANLWFRSFSHSDYMVCMVRDVSSRLKAQAEREALIAELERKNIELEQFLYTASHDLKTPLTTVKGFTGLLAEDIASGDVDAVCKDLQRINEGADQMLALLNDLLNLSRIGRIKLQEEPVSLAELATEAKNKTIDEFGPETVHIDVGPGLPKVYGNRTRLLEAFNLLLDNAVKFSIGAAFISISASCNEHNELVICIADQGIGVEPRHQENIFGLFNQLDPSMDGTGVGLTIVRQVVELHGGRIWVESKGKGTGASFCFTLPGLKTNRPRA
ncbi:MAG: HAMP domain-containing histidine kinase [Proteobacteria bacterium]|nr:HAMP domain-containing histidine kinase [Pseudomonadota bacterium]